MARTILVVDDERTLRETLAESLERKASPSSRPPTAARPWRRSGATAPT